MFRKLLIGALCIAIAFIGVSGLHVHVPDESLAHAHELPFVAEHAHATTILDADHAADHEQHGDIDIDPIVKAFGKWVLNSPAPLVALFYVLFGLLLGLAGSCFSHAPPRRPPRRALLPYFLPPSQAPPTTA